MTGGLIRDNTVICGHIKPERLSFIATESFITGNRKRSCRETFILEILSGRGTGDCGGLETDLCCSQHNRTQLLPVSQSWRHKRRQRGSSFWLQGTEPQKDFMQDQRNTQFTCDHDHLPVSCQCSFAAEKLPSWC